MSTKQHEPVQSLWIGDRLTVMERLAIHSFLANGHPFHLYTYEPVEGVPEGVSLFDARKVVSEDRVFKYSENQGGGYQGFADIFRYELLYQRGGWWVDMDVVCLRPFDHASEVIVCTSDEGSWGDLACNFVLRTNPGGDLFERLVQGARKAEEGEMYFGQTAAVLIQKLVDEAEDKSFLVPAWHFSPLKRRRIGQTIAIPKGTSGSRVLAWRTKELGRRILKPQEAVGTIRRESYAVHLWNETWRRWENLDKEGEFHPWCLYEKLKRRYLPKE